MADSKMTGSKKPSLKLLKNLSPKATMILFGVLIVYGLLKPSLEGWLNVDLPPFDGKPAAVAQQNEDESIAVDESLTATGHSSTKVASTKAASTESTQESSAPSAVTHPVTPPMAETSSAKTAATPASKKKKASSTVASRGPPKLGELKDVGRKVMQSTAGLHYRPGSAEGHRVKHVLRHNKDDTSRPVHGVFDGDANEVFAVIDEAYLYTFDNGPPKVKKEIDDGRTIYIVDLGRRIGYIGGQKGKRTKNPSANFVQLVLEGQNVITAYPVRVERRRR